MELNASPVCDFLLTIELVLEVESGTDKIIEESGWVKRVRADVDPSLLKGLELFFNVELYGGRLLTLVRQAPGSKSVDEYLGMLERMEPVRLFEAVAYADGSYWPPDGSEFLPRALGGDEGAIRELLEGYRSDEDRAAAEKLLVLGAEGVKEKLLGLLRRWQEEVFAEEEERIRPILERDVEAKRRLAEHLSSQELVEAATHGVRWAPFGGVTGVVLAPSYFARPVNFSFVYEGIEFFCYAVADESLEEAPSLEPKPAMTRLYKALSDPTRLKILKLLAEREMYLQQIAEELELAKPTVHHHLLRLRSAGLVTLAGTRSLEERSQKLSKHYALRPEAFEDASRLLKEYLEGSKPAR